MPAAPLEDHGADTRECVREPVTQRQERAVRVVAVPCRSAPEETLLEQHTGYAIGISDRRYGGAIDGEVHRDVSGNRRRVKRAASVGETPW